VLDDLAIQPTYILSLLGATKYRHRTGIFLLNDHAGQRGGEESQFDKADFRHSTGVAHIKGDSDYVH
jgi:hypothetical protein